MEDFAGVILGLNDKAFDDLLSPGDVRVLLLEPLIDAGEPTLEGLLTSLHSLVQLVGLTFGLLDLFGKDLGAELIGCHELVLELVLHLETSLFLLLLGIGQALISAHQK